MLAKSSGPTCILFILIGRHHRPSTSNRGATGVLTMTGRTLSEPDGLPERIAWSKGSRTGALRDEKPFGKAVILGDLGESQLPDAVLRLAGADQSACSGMRT